MEALTGVMNTIVAYLPNVLAALGILLLGWLIALLLRRVVAGLVRRTPLNAWLGRRLAGRAADTATGARAPAHHVTRAPAATISRVPLPGPVGGGFSVGSGAPRPVP
jgi:hypothetical protein